MKRRSRMTMSFACMSIALAAARPAFAQTAGPDRAEDLAARALARAAMLDLKLVSPPSERDYRVAAALLDIAHRLSPREQQILRLLIEAETASGSAERVLALTRSLVAIDPSDTVAQLRLITGRITAMQDSDARLSVYNRFLGFDGESLDPSIRSRLALDAALLERERGDLSRFADRLALAIELDSTNKDAATLALSFAQERGVGEIELMELLLGVMYADPYDAEVHRAIAQSLAAQGAFTGAARFLRILDRLYSAQGGGPDADEQAFREVVDWSRTGAESVVRRLSDDLDERRKEVLRKLQNQPARRAGDPEPERPEDVRLSFASERTRLIAASAIGDVESAGVSIVELTETARRLAESLADPARRGEDLSEADATAKVQSILAEVVWLRLWSGQQIEEASAGLVVMKKDRELDPKYVARLEGWLALRRSEFQRAAELLAPIAQDDPLAELGVAVMLERAADRRPAAVKYMDLSIRHAGQLLGAYARTRVQQITGAQALKTDAARALEDAAASVPEWVETSVSTPGRVVSLRVEATRPDVRVMERTALRVTMGNLSPIPLGVGPDRPLSSRLMLVPTVEVQALPVAGGELMEVASLDRRLRLMPREELEAVIWGDGGALGSLLDLSSGTPSRVRWRVLQGFRMTDARIYDHGPHSVLTDTPTLARRANPRFLLDVDGLRGAIESGGPREAAEAVLAMRARQARTVDLPMLTPSEIDMLAESLAARLSTAEAPVKLLLLAVMPTPVVQPAFQRVDQMCLSATDRDVLTVLLVLRASEASSPIFSAPGVAGDPALSELAELLRTRLSEGKITLACNASDARPAGPVNVGPPKPESLETADPGGGR